MPYDSIVLVKQVPDPRRVSGQAMTDEGTVNRAALPPIFNPEDLNALEMALSIKDQFGGTVTVLTMGLPSAAQVLREALYRGADAVALLTDRRMARADTLATSYTLSQAVRTVGRFDFVFCGRQAIDGDTAQVGPQTAEKLGLPQLTYVEEIQSLEDGRLRARRAVEGGYEIVEAPLPILLTVPATANNPRPASAKRLMQFKRARTRSEIEAELAREARERNQEPDPAELQAAVEERAAALESRGLLIPEWNLEAIGADPDRCGGAGSPTLVARIERPQLQATAYREIENTEEGLRGLLAEFLADHILE